MKETARRSVVWVAVVCPLLAACWQASEQRPLGGLTLGIYVAVAGFLILCERLLAFDGAWGSAIKGTKTDFLYVLIAAVMDKAAFVVCVTAIASAGRVVAGSLGISPWPSHWSFWLQVVVALLIADMAAYFRHRLFHKSAFLWRFHRIHHSMTEMYWIRSAYTHPVEQLFILMAIMLPISVLGAGNEVIVAVAFSFGLSGWLQHANIDSRSAVLNYVFATPEVHRVHHRADEIGNRSNFSAFFVLMDILFGSYHRPARSETPVRVGLEGVTAFPRDFLSHLVMPFKRDPAELDENALWEHAQNEIPAARKP